MRRGATRTSRPKQAASLQPLRTDSRQRPPLEPCARLVSLGFYTLRGLKRRQPPRDRKIRIILDRWQHRPVARGNRASLRGIAVRKVFFAFTRWNRRSAAARAVRCAVCLISAAGGKCFADEAGISARHHSWGRFQPGAWKVVRVVTETYDDHGVLAEHEHRGDEDDAPQGRRRGRDD